MLVLTIIDRKLYDTYRCLHHPLQQERWNDFSDYDHQDDYRVDAWRDHPSGSCKPGYYEPDFAARNHRDAHGQSTSSTLEEECGREPAAHQLRDCCYNDECYCYECNSRSDSS